MNRFVPDFSAIGSLVVEDFDGASIAAFRDCHHGERCFILGNGPSLQRTELAPLADEITIGVNGIFYMTRQCGFSPTYYVVEDNHVLSDNLTRVNNVQAVAKFFPSKYQPIIPPSPDTHFLPTDWSFYWGSSDWYETPRFSHDLARVIFAGQTVTFMNIQLAAYMGCTEIYLVGVDFDYTIPETAHIDGLTITSVDDDPNHFHPDYFGKGKKWHLPKLENVEQAMACARQGVEERGSAIFNATIGGKLETFERADYHEVIGRPTLADPNLSSNYLLTRSLENAARLGAQTVAVESPSTTNVDAIVSASPLRLSEHGDPDVLVTFSRQPGFDHGAVCSRVLVLPSDDVVDGDESGPTPEWFAELLVDRLVKRSAAFWTRSVLELSADGESVLLPALGRSALRVGDPRCEFGLDGIGNVDDDTALRSASGRSLSIDQIAELAREIADHQHSVGVVDGYIYVQSRWKPNEPAKALWVTRRGGTKQGRTDVGLRT